MTMVLATDGGPHPADKWASATAEMLVPLDAITDGHRRNAAKRLQADIADALEPHHKGVHDAEKAGIKANGFDHFDTDFDHTNHTPDALATVIACAKGTLWEDHFAKPEVQAVAAEVIASHFNSGADIERQWHADRSPEHPVAIAYKTARHYETPQPIDTPAAE